MTTRPALGERSSFAHARPSPELIAHLRANPHPTRHHLPEPPPALVTDEHGDVIDIVPLPMPAREEQPVERYPVRHTAVLVNRNATTYRPLPGDEKARLWQTAGTIEAKTKSKGSRVGCLGDSALRIFNTLLFKFANSTSGRCDPSYAAIQRETGKCVDTIAKSLNKLAACGLLTVTRRWLRFWDPQLGRWVARQITNAYTFAAADRRLFPVPSPARVCGPIPRHDPEAPYRGPLARVLAMALLSGKELKHNAKPRSDLDPRNPPDGDDAPSPLVNRVRGQKRGSAKG